MRYRLILLTLSTLLLTCGQAFSSAWETRLAEAEGLVAAGYADSAAVVLRQTLAGALAEYSESDTTVKVGLCRDGLVEPFYFRSLEDAESLFVRALRLKQAISKEEDLELARIMSDLAAVYDGAGVQPEARGANERALAIQERVLGPDHVDVAVTLGRLAGYFNYELREYETAESLYTLALSIQERAFGPDHRALTEVMYPYAHMLENMGRFEDAVAIQERDLAIRTNAYGANSPKLLGTLTRMAYCLRFVDRVADSESLLTRALAISEQEYGPDSFWTAYALRGLGIVYKDHGDFAEAEAVLRRSLSITGQVYGRGSARFAGSCITLGNVYLDQGRYADAARLYGQAIEIFEKLEKPNPVNVGVALYNLAHTYRDQGRYAEAEPLFTRAVELWTDTYGQDHYHVGGGLTELGFLYLRLGDVAKAESLFHRAIAIADVALGPQSFGAARARKGLGDVYLKRGLYAEAESYLMEALDIWNDDPEALAEYLPLTLESLVKLYRCKGDPDVALATARRAMEIRRSNFLDNVQVLSEKDAIAYSQFLRNAIYDYLTGFTDLGSNDEVLAGEVSDVLLSTKGQVSDGIFERQQGLVAETDPNIVALAKELKAKKYQLSRLFVEGSGDDIDSYHSLIDSLSGVVETLDAGLSRLSASYRRHQRSAEAGMGRIASMLPSNSVLVEFVRYNYRQLEPERMVPRYVALILSNAGLEAIDDLGESAEVDGLVDECKNHLLGVASSGRVPSIVEQEEYDRLSSEIYERIWRPVEQHVAGSDLVLVAPDGALNLIAFGALRTPDGQYLIEKHALHYLSAGRDLVRLEHEPEPAIGLFALGDPDYGALAAERVAALDTAGSGASGDSVVEVAFATRNVRSSCGELGEMEVAPLPGTRREVELVSERWAETTTEPVVACYGEEASEEYFKAEAPGKRVIHLATHGYFLGGACRPEGVGADFVGENPLLLSGLFLAGSNLHGESADSLGVDDGILTAYEVSAMDLEGTELVVLSACETGLGKVSEGEGVYGLRRAFQMAGARTVVSALWPVSDEATAEMMGELYARRDESLPEAMRRAQIKRIEELRSGGQVDHPFTWGAFIALGDWR
jgi:CHAT domain-containing protein/tetratricopeptide (TPR) repeat protein